MASQIFTQTQQSDSPYAVYPGTWKLPAGRAITWQPREAGLLWIAHGQLWVTLDGPHAGPGNDLGDRVLQAGSRIVVQAGQRLVIEAWSKETPAHFTWDPIPAAASDLSSRRAHVIQSLADLRLALGMMVQATMHLARGVASLAWGLIAVNRTRRLAGLFAAADSPDRYTDMRWAEMSWVTLC